MILYVLDHFVHSPKHLEPKILLVEHGLPKETTTIESEISMNYITSQSQTLGGEKAKFCYFCNKNRITYYTFFYKEHLYKELEAEKGSKNKEFLRN